MTRRVPWRPETRWSCATEELGLGGDEIIELDACMHRILSLGAKTAVVRAHNGEIVAIADRSGPNTCGSRTIARRFALADLGVLSDVDVDLQALDAEAERVEQILSRARAAR